MPQSPSSQMTAPGTAATIGEWLPQLLRTWRCGRADDISYIYLAIFAAGVLGWLAYGLLAAQPAVFAANVVTFTLIAALTLLKTRPRRPPAGHPADGRGHAASRKAWRDRTVRGQRWGRPDGGLAR